MSGQSFMNLLRTLRWSTLLLFLALPGNSLAAPPWLSPSALVASPNSQHLYVACRDAAQVLGIETVSWTVQPGITVPPNPSGLAVSPDGTLLVVTCAAPESKICVINLAERKVDHMLEGGHTAGAPVFSPDGRTLYICNRFNNDVSVFDLASRREVRRIAVRREPIAAALTRDGRWLYVANHLPAGPANARHVAAVVSVIDIQAGTVVKELVLPNGSGSLTDVRVSPDGRHAVVSHVLSRHQMPTTQLDRGWMNTNAKTLIDIAKHEIITTVLLDTVDRGAANPWGLAWTADGKRLAVALAGTHELAVIDFPGVLERFQKISTQPPAELAKTYGGAALSAADIPNDLGFLTGLSRRVKLPETDLGPRAVVVLGNTAITANYFGDTLTLVDLEKPEARPRSLPLGPAPQMTVVRQGELYFHDARICFQGWQSCATCHPGEARVDALNWDLLNDGIGNPRNNKSLLFSHRTPPAMSTGVRDTAETAVRSGVKFILFTVQPEFVYNALDEYLKTLRPEPSPYLEKGKLSEAARRGEKIFRSDRAGCASCHTAPLFTDQQPYDVGTSKGGERLDTPTLIELWRTAPYLNDGSAATLREVLTTANQGDRHGVTSHLTPRDLEDLETYLNSL